jgi:hypothetical protein
MGMQQWWTTVDTRRQSDRWPWQPPFRILHSRLCQFEHCIYCKSSGGPRLPAVHGIHELAVLCTARDCLHSANHLSNLLEWYVIDLVV